MYIRMMAMILRTLLDGMSLVRVVGTRVRHPDVALAQASEY